MNFVVITNLQAPPGADINQCLQPILEELETLKQILMPMLTKNPGCSTYQFTNQTIHVKLAQITVDMMEVRLKNVEQLIFKILFSIL